MAFWSIWTLPFSLIVYLKFSQAQTSSDCGNAPLNTKVVGGQNVTAGAWPWQVSMHRGGGHICGGTLISNQWVLTAAHCLQSTPSPSAWILYLGRQVQDGSNPNEVARTVEEIIPHAQFNNTLFNNDIALMKLSSAVSFTDYIQPICLASSTSLFHNGTQCWATGWGRIEKDVPLPPPKTLQEVDVPVIGNRQCTCQYASAKDADITENMICAGQENKGICQGDSGGPVQCKQGSVWVQAGIASFGIPCATSGFPEVYARVSRYEDWIKDKVGSTVGFVTFRSAGDDPDSSFKCSNTANLIFPQFFLSVSLLVLFSTLMH